MSCRLTTSSSGCPSTGRWLVGSPG
jgi:hypothetical protein